MRTFDSGHCLEVFQKYQLVNCLSLELRPWPRVNFRGALTKTRCSESLSRPGGSRLLERVGDPRNPFSYRKPDTWQLSRRSCL